MQLPAPFSVSPAQSERDRFLVVVRWSVVLLVLSVVVFRGRHARTMFAAWLAAYVTLLAVYVVLFTDLPTTGLALKRRNFYQTYFGTGPLFDSTVAPVAPYPPAEVAVKGDPPTKTYVALSIDEIRGAHPDYDGMMRAELNHRIEYGHYSDNPDPSMVRPRWGARTDLPGILNGVW